MTAPEASESAAEQTPATPREGSTADTALRPLISYVQPGDSSLRASLIGAIERLTGRPRLQAIYQELKRRDFDASVFFADALTRAGIQYRIRSGSLEHIPGEGPVILVANHPFGVVDGLILCDIAVRRRGSFRILIHAMLCRDRDLDPFFLPIDFSETTEALAVNVRSKRAALATLREGGTVLIFPGGGIATRRRGGFGALADLPWSTFVAKLVKQSGATVVPLFFHGCNSRLFHIASGISPSLRASLLLHEARNKLGRSFDVSIGEPLPRSATEHLDRRKLTTWLHERTWALARMP